MRDEKNISRRGLLRGDWVKRIRDRGAKEIANEHEPEFVLKKPAGQSRRNGGFVLA